MSWDLESPCCKCQSNSRAVMKKGSVGAASSYAMSFQWKWWVPGTAGSSLTQRHSTGWKSKNGRQITLLHNDIWQGENRKMAGKSLYLDELLIQKCKFRGRFKVSILCLDKHSPKGSCHRDESSMNHTLGQKHLCEFWCGMHLTRKNTPVKPDRRNWMTRSERLCEENLSMPLLKESNCSDAAHSN